MDGSAGAPVTALPQKYSDGRAGLLNFSDMGLRGLDCLTARMVLGVDRLQAGLGYVRVNLGSRQTAVTQQHLHGT